MIKKIKTLATINGNVHKLEETSPKAGKKKHASENAHFCINSSFTVVVFVVNQVGVYCHLLWAKVTKLKNVASSHSVNYSTYINLCTNKYKQHWLDQLPHSPVIVANLRVLWAQYVDMMTD